MGINSLLKEHFGWGIYHQYLFRPSFRFMNQYFGRKNLTGVEIGTYKGLNAMQVLKNMKIKKLYLIDPWDNYHDYQEYKDEDLGKVFIRALRRLRSHMRKIKITKDYSENALHEIKEKVDFVYIDGNHEYRYVKKDLANSWRVLKSKGILAGHDINLTGVLRAVSEFATEKHLKLNAQEQDWWAVKTEK